MEKVKLQNANFMCVEVKVVISILSIATAYMFYESMNAGSAIVNTVLVSILLMLCLSLLKVNVVVSLLLSAIFAGVVGGLNITETIDAFNKGIGSGGRTALSYALLGAFAATISKSGLPAMFASKISKKLNGVTTENQTRKIKYLVLSFLLLAAFSSQNIIPIHIAFIPILVPPLLFMMTKMGIDRRLIACILTFGLVSPYMFFPVGFGAIFLNDILLANIQQSGMQTEGINAAVAMLIPASGMLVGLLVAVFYSYRNKRKYELEKLEKVEGIEEGHEAPYCARTVGVAVFAIVLAFTIQILTHSMIYGGVAGFLVFLLSGALKWQDSDDVFTQGMRMMAMIGFIMIAAGGFAEVLRSTGDITSLVAASAEIMGDSKAIAAILMLLVGLFITIGIGSSFSTIPIIASIYVPLALQLNFSPLAIVALVGTAAALGDAGSPASDSTLGPTAGLNIDGQHDHIWDSVVPTFIHYNFPLIAFGWIAAMVL
ncbi:MAG: putative histidine transporter YuiF (NhaC family) [Colwellia sp.]|jgi:predicted histidine transporter YuiF (NhaC family)|tara:strand:- start:255 stop:1712 length:1458 start_codon:yes stop_codon:yes gene_type:complete